MENRVGHDQLLNGELFDQLLESFIFAQSMKPVHVHMPGPHLF